MDVQKAPNSFIGRTIGNYRILEEVGRGGMGVVYRAVHIVNSHKIAVKVLKRDLALNEEFVKRFLREGQIAATLRHPNLVRVYEAGQYDDRYVMALKFVEGLDLAEVIEQKAPMSVKKALLVIRQIALGLEHAHQHGIIHRDIKPDNIIIGRSGRAMLTDFGLAKGYETLTPVTSVGTLLGTPGYMSPEQWKNEELTSRSDIYSLGIVLFEMLTGKTPFRSNTPASMMHEVIEGTFPSAANYNAEVNTALERIIAGMVEKDPARRYPSCQALVNDIDSFQKSGNLNGSNDALYTFELNDAIIDGIVNGDSDSETAGNKKRAWLFGSPVPILTLFAVVPLVVAAFATGTVKLPGQDRPVEGVRLSSADPGSIVMTIEPEATPIEEPTVDLPETEHRTIKVIRRGAVSYLDRQIERAQRFSRNNPDRAALYGRFALGRIPGSQQFDIQPYARVIGINGHEIGNVEALLPLLENVRYEIENRERDTLELIVRNPGSDKTATLLLELI